MMGKWNRWFVMAGFLLLGVAGSVVAQDAQPPQRWSDSTLASSIFGKAWQGLDVDVAELRGKVVLVEFWSYNNANCVASIPVLTALHKAYSHRGLVVIGAHANSEQREAAMNVIRGAKADFQILNSASIPTVEAKSVPYAVLFSPSGKIVWQGDPIEKKNALAKGIAQLLKEVKSDEQLWREDRLGTILAGGAYKAVPNVVQKIKAGKIGPAYQECMELAKKEGDAADQARELQAVIKACADGELDSAHEMKTTKPSKVLIKLKSIQQAYAGCHFSTEAEDVLNKLSKDKEFQAELNAERDYYVILSGLAKVPTPPDKPEQQAKWREKYGRSVKAIEARFEKFKKDYPKSAFVDLLQQRVDMYRIEAQ